MKKLLLLTAFIFSLPPSAAWAEQCQADCNCDTKVNLADLVVMKTEFLRTNCDTTPCQADCNGDDKVD
jgi:hypothetical protein